MLASACWLVGTMAVGAVVIQSMELMGIISYTWVSVAMLVTFSIVCLMVSKLKDKKEIHDGS